MVKEQRRPVRYRHNDPAPVAPVPVQPARVERPKPAPELEEPASESTEEATDDDE